MKKWIVNQPDESLAGEFSKKCDLSMLVLKLMTARKFTEFQQIVDFFSGGELSDPFEIADMKRAADVINGFIDSYELICVYGDYDCDGITATAVLYDYLQNMGANVIYYINEREAGYGMNVDAVRQLHEKGVKLIVTVDNGISCIDEAEEIARLDMKLVITDHHQPPEILPRAEAVVNPHRADCPSKFKDLAGVGVALKLCAALDDGNFEVVTEQYSDLCAIGTVGDLVPLHGENRMIVRKGMMYLKNTENTALNELIDSAGVNREKISSGTLGFQICPRINAAGRFASPLVALRAILSESEDEAVELVAQLMNLNEQRKNTEAEIYAQIKTHINENPDILNKRVLVLAGKNWHHGVIGIVSSRVLEAYGKPNIILSITDDGEVRGSARSLKGFNIHSCFTYAAEYLEKYGGHECAGGLSLRQENIGKFTEKVLEYAEQIEIMPTAVTECDMVIKPEELEIAQIKTLETLQPFGVGNPQPVFALPDCRVNAIYPLSNGKHTKLDVNYCGKKQQVLIFSKSPSEMFFKTGDSIDIAAHIDINEFNGRESVSIKAVDIKPHAMDTDKYTAAKDCYERFKNGAEMPPNFLKKITPTRQELVYLYKLIRQQEGGEIGLDSLFMQINHPSINYCKLRIMADVFCEAKLAKINPAEQKIKILPAEMKANLMETESMRKLRIHNA